MSPGLLGSAPVPPPLPAQTGARDLISGPLKIQTKYLFAASVFLVRKREWNSCFLLFRTAEMGEDVGLTRRGPAYDRSAPQWPPSAALGRPCVAHFRACLEPLSGGTSLAPRYKPPRWGGGAERVPLSPGRVLQEQSRSVVTSPCSGIAEMWVQNLL